MAANILKEFLMSIGFKVDEVSLKKWEAALQKSEGVVVGLGAATTAVAALIDRNIVKVAESYDKLFYASVRIGSSVKNIQTLNYAARMIGVSADQSTGALEGFARAMRLNPGLSGYLNQLGVKTKGRDIADQYEDLLDRLEAVNKKSTALAAQRGEQFGIPSDTLNLLLKNRATYKEAAADHLRRLAAAGLDPNRVKDQSVQFERDLAHLIDSMDIFKALITERFLPYIDKAVKVMSHVVDAFARWDNATGGKSTVAIAGGVTAGTAITAGIGGYLAWTKILPALLKKVGIVSKLPEKLPTKIPGFLGGAGTASAETEAVVATEEVGAGAVAAGLLPVVVGVLAALGLSWMLKSTGLLDKMEKFGEEHSVAKTFAAATEKVKAFGQAVSVDAKKGGQALANGLEAFVKRSEGLRHTAYADANGRAIGYGHKILPGEKFGYLDDVTANRLLNLDLSKAKSSVQRLTKGVNLTDGQIAALDDFQFNTGALAGSKLLRLVRSGKFEDAAKEFERWDKYHKDGKVYTSQDLFNRRLGDEQMFRGAPTVNQHTEIIVHGSGDPAATGRAVLRGHHHATADAVRNAVSVPG